MIYFLLNVCEVAPYALKIIKQLASPYHIRTMVDLLKYCRPTDNLAILKVLKKLKDSNIPDEIFTQALNEKIEFKSAKKSVFSSGISNQFAKFLYEYAFEIRTLETNYEQK